MTGGGHLRRLESCENFLSVADFERAAKRRLPAPVFEYLRGGTEDELSLHENRAVFDRLGFLPRGLRNVAQRNQAVTLWGKTYASPFGLAPTGVNAIVCHDCDAKLASEAAHAKVPYIISGASNVALERLAKIAPGCWYQAYFPGDRTRIEKILTRLGAATIDTLVVTMDTCVAANRENNIRNDFTIPFHATPRLVLEAILHPRWSMQVFAKTLLTSGIPRFANMYETTGPRITEDTPDGFRAGRDQLDWDDLKWLRDQWPGKLLVKGVMHPADALLAAEVGVDAIIVSNHGGRQLDGAISTLQALPQIVATVPATLPVFVDGGFRRGTDILKAIALGARLVFLGRPPLYGAAVRGAPGIRRVLDLLRNEIDRDLALLACNAIDDVRADLLNVCGPPSIRSSASCAAS